MAIINLRDYYPFYTSDCFMEVSEEVAEMFKEFDRKEAAYRLRTYRHKAYYSLDRDDGLEHEAVFVALSPHELYERKVTMQELHAAISSLPARAACIPPGNRAIQNIRRAMFLPLRRADRSSRCPNNRRTPDLSFDTGSNRSHTETAPENRDNRSCRISRSAARCIVR